MKKAFLISISLILVFFLACIGETDEEKEFYRIYKKTYVINEYDCSNKCAELLTYLHERGETDIRIWSCEPLEGRKERHAIVEWKGLVYDVTNNRVMDNLSIVKSLDGYSIDYSTLKILILARPKEWAF
jgi:hypothetical protein